MGAGLRPLFTPRPPRSDKLAPPPLISSARAELPKMEGLLGLELTKSEIRMPQTPRGIGGGDGDRLGGGDGGEVLTPCMDRRTDIIANSTRKWTICIFAMANDDTAR